MAIEATTARATQAYAQALGNLGKMGEGGAGATGASSGPSGFAQVLGGVLENAMQAGKTSEAAAVQAAAGKADVAGVVTAINNAELALETVVAVRDRVISAYQEIMRMPI